MKPRYAAVSIVSAAIVFAAFGVFVLLSVSPTSATADRYRGSEPPDGILFPKFKLRGYTGSVTDSRNLGGKVVVVTFLESKCKEACPIIAVQIGRAIALLSPQERRSVVALAISTQPHDDTPASVRLFLRRQRVEGKFRYLVGSENELRPVWNDFHVLSALDSGDANTHSASVRVFDPKREWVSSLHVGVDLTPTNLVHDIRLALDSRR